MSDLRQPVEAHQYVNWDESHELFETFIISWFPVRDRSAVTGGISRSSLGGPVPRFQKIGEHIFSQDPNVSASVWVEVEKKWVGLSGGEWVVSTSDGHYLVCSTEEFEKRFKIMS